jgi:hypothetical protein
MTTNGNYEMSEDSVFAQLASEVTVTTVSSAKATAPETVFLKVAVPSTATKVRVSFDPVSVEEGRQTRALNRSVRLGFMPPSASTR